VWNRTPGRDGAVVARGADRVGEPADLLAAVDAAIVMLPDLAQLEELVDGPAALLSKVTTRTVLVVCSTVSPTAVREFAERVTGSTGGLVTLLDAPVSGGPEGAAAGSLSIMVGGDEEDVVTARPALDAMGKTVRHVGALGAGSLAKACNQMVVSATMIALAEAATLAESAGVDVPALLDILAGGLAGSRLLELKRDNLVGHTYAATGPARYMLKDLGFVHRAAEETGAAVDQAELSRGVFTALHDAGLGDEDMSVVHELIRRRSGLTADDR
ncbi:MAG: NAD(P)-dependent oxidoreductase, partial [Nocardioidaceae bacterium]